MERACHGAGYRVKQVELEVSGEVKEGSLVVEGTGQTFTLEGDAPKAGPHKLLGSIRGWATGWPTFRVTRWE